MRVLIIKPGQTVDSERHDIICDLEEMVQQVPSSAATVIDCQDSLDYVMNQIETLSVVVSKLRYGGRITLHGLDLYELSLRLLRGEVNLQETSNLIYNGRQSSTGLLDVMHKLEQLGLTIQIGRLNEIEYYISAERPLKNE